MTPKEKAQELIKQYSLLSWKGKEFKLEYYKQCSLIVVNEILNRRSFLISLPLTDIKWWEEVKREIEKL